MSWVLPNLTNVVNAELKAAASTSIAQTIQIKGSIDAIPFFADAAWGLRFWDGVGEPSIAVAAPAVLNAIFAATGKHKLAELTDTMLFGDVWERPGLSKRDHSLVTVAAIIAINRPDQLRSYLARARENGVTQEEVVEAITHLAFYAGWPNAVTAVGDGIVDREETLDLPW